jgi:hypothetical protein
VERALRTELSLQRKLRRMLVTAAIIGPVALAPEVSFAEGLFDFFFRAFQGQQQAAPQGDPFNNNPETPPPRAEGCASKSIITNSGSTARIECSIPSSAPDRRGPASSVDRPSIFYRDQHRAGVGAIVRACCANHCLLLGSACHLLLPDLGMPHYGHAAGSCA